MWVLGAYFFFFQAEDGIRDTELWLEFRRVLFRSIQARNALVGEKGYSGQLSQTTTNSDPYGGLALPELNLSTLIPTDLLNPSGLPECSHEQLNQGLSQYASASRAMQLYQAGYKYIADVGKVKQQSHKAQSSIIKGVTEEVKVQQNIVDFDVANIELEQKLEKRNQAEETLKQEQIKTVAAINETEQLRQKLEAQEDKREAEVSNTESCRFYNRECRETYRDRITTQQTE